MYTALVHFHFGEKKRLVKRVKQTEIVVQDSSKSTGISGKMEKRSEGGGNHFDSLILLLKLY